MISHSNLQFLLELCFWNLHQTVLEKLQSTLNSSFYLHFGIFIWTNIIIEKCKEKAGSFLNTLHYHNTISKDYGTHDIKFYDLTIFYYIFSEWWNRLLADGMSSHFLQRSHFEAWALLSQLRQQKLRPATTKV